VSTLPSSVLDIKNPAPTPCGARPGWRSKGALRPPPACPISSAATDGATLRLSVEASTRSAIGVVDVPFAQGLAGGGGKVGSGEMWEV